MQPLLAPGTINNIEKVSEGHFLRSRKYVKDTPVIFALHNNRWLIPSMVHARSNESPFHVRGFMDRGTTTPFDLVVVNKMRRFH
jgi:phosphoketolase